MPQPQGNARRRRELSRQREARKRRAAETQRSQQGAAARAGLQTRRRRQVQAYVLFGLAALVAIGHVFEHGGAISFMSPGMQDLLIGYPTAGVLAIIGAARLGT